MTLCCRSVLPCSSEANRNRTDETDGRSDSLLPWQNRKSSNLHIICNLSEVSPACLGWVWVRIYLCAHMAPCPRSGLTFITHENSLLYRLHLKQSQHPFPAEYVGFHWAAGHHLMNPPKLPQRPQHHQTSILLHSRLLSIRVMIGVARQLWVQLRDSVILKRPCRIPRNAAVHKHTDWRCVINHHYHHLCVINLRLDRRLMWWAAAREGEGLRGFWPALRSSHPAGRSWYPGRMFDTTVSFFVSTQIFTKSD